MTIIAGKIEIMRNGIINQGQNISTWCTGICEIIVSGEGLLKASVISMQTARHWNGSSAPSHHRLPSRGLLAESNMSSR
jgi:hypothetical protein